MFIIFSGKIFRARDFKDFVEILMRGIEVKKIDLIPRRIWIDGKTVIRFLGFLSFFWPFSQKEKKSVNVILSVSSVFYIFLHFSIFCVKKESRNSPKCLIFYVSLFRISCRISFNFFLWLHLKTRAIWKFSGIFSHFFPTFATSCLYNYNPREELRLGNSLFAFLGDCLNTLRLCGEYLTNIWRIFGKDLMAVFDELSKRF